VKVGPKTDKISVRLTHKMGKNPEQYAQECISLNASAFKTP